MKKVERNYIMELPAESLQILAGWLTELNQESLLDLLDCLIAIPTEKIDSDDLKAAVFAALRDKVSKA